MKRTIRLTALLLVAALLVCACTACGTGEGKASSEDTPSSGAASSEAAGEDISKKVELSMYVVSDRPVVQDQVEENYNKVFEEKLNCTLKVNWIGWAEYKNKYPLLFSSGEVFDMAYTSTWLNFSPLARKGAFKELDELWPKYAPKNYERQSEMALRQSKVNGHSYCIPTLLGTYSASGPTYRTDILEGTDWDGKMETIADYEEFLEYAKEAAPEMEPYNVYQSGSDMDEVYMKSKGLYGLTGGFLWLDPSEEKPQVFTYYEYGDTPEFLTMMSRWNEKGFFSKSALSDTDSQKFRGGKAASRITNLDAYPDEYIRHPEWGVKYANLVSDVSNLPFTQDAMAIASTSKNPERALMLYDLITSDQEVFNAFYYGVEGVNYKIIDGQIENLAPDDFVYSACWSARTPEFDMDDYGSPADLPDIRASFDSHIEEMKGEGSQKYTGFVMDTAAIETEFAACQNVHQQYWWPLELAYTDAESGLQEYEEKMEVAGIERIREEVQRQLDEYLDSLEEK